jgi:epoxyqueuosine reductase
MTASAGAAVTGERRELLRRRLRDVGFDEVRFAAVTSFGRAGLAPWLDQGLQADMAWMERTKEKRLNPDLVLAGARTVIILGVNYGSPSGRPALAAAAGETGKPAHAPVWARYALHADYHDTIKPGLAAAGRVLEELGGLAATDYRYYVDTGPVLERGWAARSGLGFRGKNAMLISKQHGNWLLLASILTRWEITADEPLRKKLPTPDQLEPTGLLCGKCTRCLDACPTDAFSQPGVVDARRCISYHTIENKGIIPRELRRGIGARIYGCDVCLEVCPWNRFAQAGRRMLLSARGDIAELDLGEILALTPLRFAEIFKGTAIKRLKLVGLLRNACIVAANTGAADLLPTLQSLAEHASPIVRAHAVWAVQQLAGAASAQMRLAVARLRETDPLVLAEYDQGASDLAAQA